ncbi:MAG TPA: universal stress protein [Gemmatimonadaceae bacterium]|nr:universal stress protein [Gemmatimonadaceae bacterium]
MLGHIVIPRHLRDRIRPNVRLLTLKRILVATDLTETSDAALLSAGRLATAAGAALHVVHVTRDREAPISHTGRSWKYAREIEHGMRRAGVARCPWHNHIFSGNAPYAIASLADRISADVIVLGRHAEGQLPTPRPVGGTAYAVITGSDVPCLAVMRPLAVPASRMLVTIDHSEAARGAVVAAVSWASGLRSRDFAAAAPTLIVLHVASTGAMQGAPASRSVDDELDRIRRVAGAWGGVVVEGVTVAGDDPATGIAAYAREHEIQLLVLGTRGLSVDESTKLGSVSAAVTSMLEIPVLLVPPAVWRNYAADLHPSKPGAIAE